MRLRHPVPRQWLMTDERLGDALWTILVRMPRGSGVVFRHYQTPATERAQMLARVVRIAKRRGLVLVVAGGAQGLGTGLHNLRRRGAPHGLVTRSAHSLLELRRAERAGADAVFLSSVFATRSHPGARTLGRSRFALIARQARIPVIALGGMTARVARTLPHASGWAGIDAWLD